MTEQPPIVELSKKDYCGCCLEKRILVNGLCSHCNSYSSYQKRMIYLLTKIAEYTKPSALRKLEQEGDEDGG